MPYRKPTLWDWIKLIPKMIYWRFIWKPKDEDAESDLLRGPM
jgi:hypothetical protein